MKRSIRFAGGVLGAIEFVAFALAAIGLVAVGPFIWCYRLFAGEHFVWAALVCICWLYSVAIVGFEVRRRAITAISFGVFLAWLVVLVWVFHLGA